jgi:phospholipid transport system substrate-binding protein
MGKINRIKIINKLLVISFCLFFVLQSGHANAISKNVILEQPANFHTNFLVIAGSKGDAVSADRVKIAEGAEKFIDKMASKALSFLSNESLSQDKKRIEFEALLNESFDMKTISRFSLGRYWRVSSDQQKKEYQKLFREMVIDVYSARFLEYSGQEFETRGYRPDGTKDTIVNSFVITDKGPDVQVDWRVRFKNGKYQVVDVIVEGVSMSVTQRSDFASVIQRGGGDIKVLLAHLREQ